MHLKINILVDEEHAIKLLILHKYTISTRKVNIW